MKFLKLKKNKGGSKKEAEKDQEIDLDDLNEKYEKARQLANIDPGKLFIYLFFFLNIYIYILKKKKKKKNVY